MVKPLLLSLVVAAASISLATCFVPARCSSSSFKRFSPLLLETASQAIETTPTKTSSSFSSPPMEKEEEVTHPFSSSSSFARGPHIRGTLSKKSLALWTELVRMLRESPDVKLQQQGDELERHLENPPSSRNNDDDEKESPKVDSRYANYVMNSFLRSRIDDPRVGAQRALDVFQLVKSLYGQRKSWFVPNAILYLTAMRAHARSGSGEGAERLLRELWQKYENRDESHLFAPNAQHYATVMEAWSRSSRSEEMGMRAERLLSEMWRKHESFPELRDLKPNRMVHNAVLYAWANSNVLDSSRNALQMVKDMWRMYDSSRDNEEDDDGDGDMAPDRSTYLALLYALSKSSRLGTWEKANDAIAEMWERHESDPDLDLKPDIRNYRSLISTMTRAKDCHPTFLKNVLEDMWKRYDNGDGDESLAPDTYIYHSVMHAWARSRSPDAGKETERLLSEMWNKCEGHPDLDIKPNRKSYNAVMNAWTKSSPQESDQEDEDEEVEDSTDIRAERVSQIMEEMRNKSKEVGDENLAPDMISYNCLIDAWSKSSSPDAGKKAEGVLADMWKMHEEHHPDMKPNAQNYNAALNAWAKSNDPNAVENASRLLEEMWSRYKEDEDDKNLAPNAISYSCLIDAHRRSSSPDAGRNAESILKDMWNLHKEHPEWNIQPNRGIYMAVIRAYGEGSSNDPDGEAEKHKLRITEEMQKKFGGGITP